MSNEHRVKHRDEKNKNRGNFLRGDFLLFKCDEKRSIISSRLIADRAPRRLIRHHITQVKYEPNPGSLGGPLLRSFALERSCKGGNNEVPHVTQKKKIRIDAYIFEFSLNLSSP